MEYAKDEFFNIRYNNDLDRLEVRKKKRPIIQLIKNAQDYKFSNYSSYNVFVFKFFPNI